MFNIFSTIFSTPHDPFPSILEEVRSLYTTLELYKETLNSCITTGKTSEIDSLFSQIDSVLERISSDLSDMQNCLQVSEHKLDEMEVMKRRRDIACYRAKMMDAQHQVKAIKSKVATITPSSKSSTPFLSFASITSSSKGKIIEPTPTPKRVTFETTSSFSFPPPSSSSSSTKNPYVESNTMFLQTQKKEIDKHFEEQDKMLDDLLGVTKRLKGVSLEINKEIDVHSRILDDMEVKVDKANAKLNKENRSLRKLKEAI